MSDTPLDFFVAHGGCTEIALGVFVQFKGITDGGVGLSVVKQPRHITAADVPEELVDELRRKWENALLDKLEGESCQSLVRSLLERNTGGWPRLRGL